VARPGGPCPLDMGETMTYTRFRSPSDPHSGLYRLVRESLLAPPSAGIPSRVFGFRESRAPRRKGFPHAWERGGNLVPVLSKMAMLSATIIASPTSRVGMRAKCDLNCAK